MYYAAHAVVRKQNDDGSYTSETAWGDGYPFNEDKSWSTYNYFSTECFQAGTKTLWLFDNGAANITDYYTDDTGDLWGWLIYHHVCCPM